jgi:hypothetical protein
VNRRARSSAGIAGIALTVVLLLQGCTFRGIDLVRDQRVQFVSPVDQATVQTPLTVKWRAKDVGRLSFAVFVDRRTMRAGSTLRSLVPKDDTACRADPKCPDAAWLSSNGVYLVKGTSLTLSSLKDNRPDNKQSVRDAHTITIVLLDGTKRAGEGSWSRQVYVDRSNG